MKRKTVKSSNIKSVGYDIKNKILELEFNNEVVYYYKDVGAVTTLEFIFAESLGKYFAQNIKSKYKYMKGEFNG
jgi:hypothetical protein